MDHFIVKGKYHKKNIILFFSKIGLDHQQDDIYLIYFLDVRIKFTSYFLDAKPVPLSAREYAFEFGVESVSKQMRFALTALEFVVDWSPR